MLLLIAWRNIWRNKVRSLIVIVSVMVGLWAGAFIMGYGTGMINQRIEDAINNEISHFQVHHPLFDEDYEAKYIIPSGIEIASDIKQDDEVEALTARVISFGMVQSAKNSAGGKYIGIDPENENTVTNLADQVIEGEFITKNDKNKILIGRKLQEKLKVKLNSKVVLTCQDTAGNIVAGAFKIKGIYSMYNTGIEKTNIYMRQEDLAELLDMKGSVHEIAGLVKDPRSLDIFLSGLSFLDSILIEDWKAIAPELALMIESMDEYLVIFIGIILLALAFGIINTMLMAVLERYKEIGMLMGIGMNKRRVFLMIVFETIMLVFIAVPIGLLAAYLHIEYLGNVGMDVSGMYAEGYAEFGFKSIIYPELEGRYYIQIMFMVTIAALLSSILPAFTAISLKPVEAIRKI
jgi:ABC-type lipoprotein release transport system permease subunit